MNRFREGAEKRFGSSCLLPAEYQVTEFMRPYGTLGAGEIL